VPVQSLEQVREAIQASRWAEAISNVRLISDARLRQFTSEQIQELARLLKVAVAGLESPHAQLWVYAFFEKLGDLLAQTGASLPDVNLEIAKAIFNKADLLEQLGRPLEAVSTYSRLIDLHCQSKDLELTRLAASALLSKGRSLASVNLDRDAIEAYEQVDALFSDSEDPVIQDRVASAFNLTGVLLNKMDRIDEAIERYDEVQRRFSHATDIALRERVGISMTNKAIALFRQDRDGEAIDICETVLRLYGDEPRLWKPSSIALNEIGYMALCEAKQLSAAGDAQRADERLRYAAELLKDAVNRSSHKPDPIILGNLGYAWFLQGHREAARRTLAQAIELGGEELRETELRDSKISPLPEDIEFRELIISL